MKITKTEFEGLYILEPKIISDERGFFFESHNSKKLKDLGIDINFVQDNQSFSKRGVIRGLHFQKPPHTQTKLIRVLSGRILDVALDLRKDQPTFGKAFSMTLSSDNFLQLIVPKGFAHGFLVLSEEAIVSYKCDEFYYPQFEDGILFTDPELRLDFRIPLDQLIVSTKDRMFPPLRKSDSFF